MKMPHLRLTYPNIYQTLKNERFRTNMPRVGREDKIVHEMVNEIVRVGILYLV